MRKYYRAKSLALYYRTKKDPVKWEEYKQKRRERERKAYSKMMSELKGGLANDDGRTPQRNSEDHSEVRKAKGGAIKKSPQA